MSIARPFPELRTGFYEHYKSTPDKPKRYNVLGLAVVQADKPQTALEANLAELEYSEDIKAVFSLYHAEGGPYPWVVLVHALPETQAICDELNGQIVVLYWACYGDAVERRKLWVRPARGQAGFLSAVEVNKQLVPRFRYVGPWEAVVS